MAENIDIQKEAYSDETEESVAARKELLVFWARMIGWLVAGVGAPITVFSLKFGLFNEYGYEVTTDELGNVTGSHIALNGWGIISVCLIGFAAISILSEIIDAYSHKYSFTKQCLVGLKNKILPIAIALGICFYLKGTIEQIIFCLEIIGLSQIAAIPLNPMPKWKSEKKGEEDYSDIITGLRTFLRRKNKEGK
jgi:hypothetical protein